MKYQTIMHEDMRNGEGLRVVLFVSGCNHNCKDCHNPQTHDENSGKPFGKNEVAEIEEQLKKSYIDGLTISGGDPLYGPNLECVRLLIEIIKHEFPKKSIWLYTGYTYEEILKNSARLKIVRMCDVLVDGPFISELADKKYQWAGSTNQRVIDVQKSKEAKEVVLYK